MEDEERKERAYTGGLRRTQNALDRQLHGGAGFGPIKSIARAERDRDRTVATACVEQAHGL